MIINSNVSNAGSASQLNNSNADLQAQINVLTAVVQDNTSAITTLNNERIADAQAFTTAALTADTESVGTANITTQNIDTANITRQNVNSTAIETNTLRVGTSIQLNMDKITAFQQNIPYTVGSPVLFAINGNNTLLCRIVDGNENTLSSFLAYGDIISIDAGEAGNYLEVGYDSSNKYIKVASTALADGVVLDVVNLTSDQTDIVAITQDGEMPTDAVKTSVATQVKIAVALDTLVVPGTVKADIVDCNHIVGSVNIINMDCEDANVANSLNVIGTSTFTGDITAVNITQDSIDTGAIVSHGNDISCRNIISSGSITANDLNATASTIENLTAPEANIAALNATAATVTGDASVEGRLTVNDMTVNGSIIGLPPQSFVGQVVITTGLNPSTIYGGDWTLVKQE